MPVRVPIGLTAGRRQGWFLSSLLLYPRFVATVTFTVPSLPGAFLVLAPRVPNPGRPWVPSSLGPWMLINIIWINSVPVGNESAPSPLRMIRMGGPGPCLFYFFEFPAVPQKRLQDRTQSNAAQHMLQQRRFCRVNSDPVSSWLCEAEQAPLSPLLLPCPHLWNADHVLTGLVPGFTERRTEHRACQRGSGAGCALSPPLRPTPPPIPGRCGACPGRWQSFWRRVLLRWIRSCFGVKEFARRKGTFPGVWLLSETPSVCLTPSRIPEMGKIHSQARSLLQAGQGHCCS